MHTWRGGGVQNALFKIAAKQCLLLLIMLDAIPNVVGGAPTSGRAHYFQNLRTNYYHLCGLKAF